jgi:hypothetical protein
VAKYHDEQAEGGREHHLVVAVHPSVTARPDEKVPDAKVPDAKVPDAKVPDAKANQAES